MKKKSMSIAIASVLVAGGLAAPASAADRISGTRVSEAVPQSLEAAVGQRFVVQYRAGSSERADKGVLEAGLASAATRAGLTRTVPATKTAGARAAASAKLLRPMGLPGYNVVTATRTLTAAESASFLRELKADPSVVSAEVDHLYRHLGTAAPMAAPNDPNYAQYQWNFFNPTGGVRAEQAWETSTGEGVVVAILDTGIVQNHADLQANVLPGYDMISDRRVSRRDADGRVPGGWDIGDWVEQNYCVQLGAPPHAADTSSWHGSHVAGTVAQETNNGTGLAGVAHGAKVVPVRVLGSCGGFGADIADGMLWAAGISVPGIPDNENPAEVLNMSLGSGGPQACPSAYQDAINQVNAQGAVIVVAAGNSNANAANYTMSSCTGVVSVGATGITGAKAGYSSWGTRVDLSAPGGGGAGDGNPNGYIWQVTNNGTQGPVAGGWILRGFTGTSMASPHVAAGAALVQSALNALGRDPLNWQQMRDLLTSTARPFPVSIPTSTPMGAGILDLESLLEKATEVPCDPEVEECAPPATSIDNQVPVRGLSGTGGDTLYAIEVPAGVSGPLSITTSGGSGNVSLHVSLDEVPTATDYDYRSIRPGNSETVRINAPAAGVYYVLLSGTYGNVTLQARHN